jgi:hypothetical protein
MLYPPHELMTPLIVRSGKWIRYPSPPAYGLACDLWASSTGLTAKWLRIRRRSWSLLMRAKCAFRKSRTGVPLIPGQWFH